MANKYKILILYSHGEQNKQVTHYWIQSPNGKVIAECKSRKNANKIVEALNAQS